MPHLTTRRFSLSFFSFVFLCLFTIAATSERTRAQDLDDVTISGRVADESDAVIVGAKVTVVLTATGATRVATTDAEGRYRLVELAPGAYTLKVSFAGFAFAERTNVNALAGENLRLDFALRPAGVSAEQTVTAEAATAPAVDTTRTVVGGTVARQEIERLPTWTRAPLDLVFTLSGVTEEPLSVRDAAEDRDAHSRAAARQSQTPEEAGTFALAGGAAYSNNVTIDGLDNNDDRAARERFQPPLEAVEEVQVITNQR